MCITSSLCVLGHVCMCVWICICYKLQNFWVQGFVLCFLQIALSVDWTSRQSIHVHEWLVVSHPSPSQPPSGLAWPGMELSGFPGPLSYWVMNEWDGLCPVIGAPGTVGAFCVTSVCRTRRQIFRNAWDEEEFAPSLSQEGSMFLWLGIKQTAAFLFSPQIICPNKRQLSWGEKYSFSSACPSVCLFSQHALWLCAFPQFSIKFPADSKAGSAALQRESLSEAFWPSATSELKANFPGWPLPCPKSPRIS